MFNIRQIVCARRIDYLRIAGDDGREMRDGIGYDEMRCDVMGTQKSFFASYCVA